MYSMSDRVTYHLLPTRYCFPCDEVLFSLQEPIQDCKHMLDLIFVPVSGTRNLFRVKFFEPSSLPKIWSLTTHLEIELLLDLVSLWRLWVKVKESVLS